MGAMKKAKYEKKTHAHKTHTHKEKHEKYQTASNHGSRSHLGP